MTTMDDIRWQRKRKKYKYTAAAAQSGKYMRIFTQMNIIHSTHETRNNRTSYVYVCIKWYYYCCTAAESNFNVWLKSGETPPYLNLSYSPGISDPTWRSFFCWGGGALHLNLRPFFAYHVTANEGHNQATKQPTIRLGSFHAGKKREKKHSTCCAGKWWPGDAAPCYVGSLHKVNIYSVFRILLLYTIKWWMYCCRE